MISMKIHYQAVTASITVSPRTNVCALTRETRLLGMTPKIFLFIFQLPAPKDISDEELLKLLEEEDEEEQLSFRIPMSLGDPHAEVDKGQFFYRTVYHMIILSPIYVSVCIHATITCQ